MLGFVVPESDFYHVAFERFLLVLSEAIVHSKRHDLVVHRLAEEPLICEKTADDIMSRRHRRKHVEASTPIGKRMKSYTQTNIREVRVQTQTKTYMYAENTE